MDKQYFLGFILTCISLAYMLILFSTSIIDLSGGRIPLNEIPTYMGMFTARFLLSTIILIIGLLLMAKPEIKVIVYRKEEKP